MVRPQENEWSTLVGNTFSCNKMSAKCLANEWYRYFFLTNMTNVNVYLLVNEFS